MDSHWSHQRPGYRCRHGHTSATPPSCGSRNADVREDRILAHLPALILRLTAVAGGQPPRPGTGRAPSIQEAIDHLRASGLALTYDPMAKTLTADTERAERILIGRHRPPPEAADKRQLRPPIARGQDGRRMADA
jgi:hypothetical protein